MTAANHPERSVGDKPVFEAMARRIKAVLPTGRVGVSYRWNSGDQPIALTPAAPGEFDSGAATSLNPCQCLVSCCRKRLRAQRIRSALLKTTTSAFALMLNLGDAAGWPVAGWPASPGERPADICLFRGE
jgi:hypothetical protein